MTKPTSLSGERITALMGQRTPREHLVDAVRGLALVMIFIDHVTGDDLNRFTLRNFGFADAAELFVLLAGFASMSAYGRGFVTEGAWSGLKKIARRCLRLYVFQMALLLVTLVIVRVWTGHYRLSALDLEPILDGSLPTLAKELSLRALPSNLDILPLYIVLLAAFPLLILGLRLRPVLTMGISVALWLAANIHHGFNLPNAFDGKPWFFNPFAWQLLFTLGGCARLVMAANDGRMPRVTALFWASLAYLALSVLEATQWRDYGLPNLAPIALPTPDKTALSPFRLLDALALTYVLLTASWPRQLIGTWLGRAFALCGRHSLEVFSLGTVLSLSGGLAFRTYGFGWPMQIAVNVIGIAGLFALAVWLDRPADAAPRSSQARAQAASRATA